MMKSKLVLLIFMALSVLAIYPAAAQTVHQVAAGNDGIKTAIDAAASGDIIELTTDGGVYQETAKITLTKSITIRAADGLTAKPIIRCSVSGDYIFKVTAPNPKIVFDNVEVDGSNGTGAASSKYFMRLDTGDSTGTMIVKVLNSVVHDFKDKHIKPYPMTGIDSLIVDNSIFYGGASEGIVLYTGSSGDPAVHLRYASFTNSTFHTFEREAIKGQTFDSTKVVVDRCTFYNLGENDKKAMIYFRNMEDVVVKNSIFAQNNNADAERFADFASDVSQFHHNVVWATTNFEVGNATVTDTLQIDPMFADPANGDFTLPMDSQLLTFGDDGGAIGDPRWIPQPAVIEIAAGTDVLSAAIAAANSGDIIELTSNGGIYQETAVMVLDKSITIRGLATLPNKPVIRCDAANDYIFKVTASSPKLVFDNVEVDGSNGTGSASSKYFLRLDTGDSTGTMVVEVLNSVVHDFKDKHIKPYPLTGISSLKIDNSIFYGGGSEGITLYSGSSGDAAAYIAQASFTNSTFYKFEREAIKGQTYPKTNVLVDGCTFYDLGENDKKAMIYFRNMENVEVKNSIFAKNNNPDAEKFADFASAVSLFHHNVVWGTTNFAVGNATVSDTLQLDPQFADPENADFTLPGNSPLLTFGDDGGPIGDPRWAPLGGKAALTVYIVGDGKVTLDPPGGLYDTGTTVKLTAVPDPGWKFIGWDGVLTFPPDNPAATITMDENKSVTANFESLTTKYQVNIASVGLGHVEAAPAPIKDNLYDEGTEVTLTPVPDSTTWEFAYWVDSMGDSLTNVNPLVFTVDMDTVFTAQFRSTIDQVALNLTVTGMGDVKVDPMPVPGFDTYDINTEITVMADAKLGWTFDGYSGDVAATDDSVVFTLDADKVVTATFSENPHPDGKLLIDVTWDLLDAVEYAHNNSQVTTIVLTDLGPYQPTEEQRDGTNGRMPEIELNSPLKIMADESLTQKPVIRGYTSSTGSTSSEGFFRFRAGSGTLELMNLIIDGYLDSATDAAPAKYLFRADDSSDTVFCSIKAYNVDFSNTVEAFWKNYSRAMVDTMMFENCFISDIGKEGLYLKATGHVNYVGIKNTTITKVAREIIYLTAMSDAVVNIDHVTIADCGFGAGSDPAKHGAVKIENTTDVQIRNSIIYKVLNTEYGYALRFAGKKSVLDNVLFFESAGEISTRDDATVGADVFWYDPMFVGPDTSNFTLADASVAYHLAGDGSAAIGDLRWATSSNVTAYNALNVAIDGKGKVTANPEPMAKFYIPGTVVSLTATPDSANSFVEWTGDLSGSDNPTTITVDADKNVTAVFQVISGVDSDKIIPTEYSLDQNYPNPFNPTTTIEFGLKEAGTTKIIIYNILGHEVKTLINQKMPAGKHSITLDAKELTSGVYFYKITSKNFTSIKKMILMK